MTNPTPGRRPPWVDDQLFPFRSQFTEIAGHSVHYVDEGPIGRTDDDIPPSPVFLMLHGNPTWSFLYRDMIWGLREKYRCIAVDYPGFGLSEAAPGYGFTAAEHSAVLQQLIERLDLRDITVMVQDWGGPIGLGAAARHADRYSGVVIGNTWGWPADDDRATAMFSKGLGGPVGTALIKRFNLFVRALIPAGHKRRKLTKAEMAMYKGPFPTPESRLPTAIFPAQILDASGYLAEVEAGLPMLADKDILITWGDADMAFKEVALKRWQATYPNANTVMLPGAGHYIQDDVGHDIVTAILDHF